MKNDQKNSIYPSVLFSCMTNQPIHAIYMKTHLCHLKGLILELHLNLWFKWTSSKLNAKCISSKHITYSCVILLHMLVFDCRHRSFSIGPTPETDPEYLSEDQCPLLIYQASKPPCSFRYNPTLSLLLSFIALGQQRFNYYFVLWLLNPFLSMTCHCHSN